MLNMPTLLTPDDRIVMVGTNDRGAQWFAVGPLRAEVHRMWGRKWSWRVWHVIGPKTIGKGEVEGRGWARDKCLESIRNLTGRQDLVLP